MIGHDGRRWRTARRALIALGFLFGSLAVALAAALPAAGAEDAPEPQGPQAAAVEQRLWQEVNAWRERQGLAPLARDAALDRLARRHSRHMVEADFFSHRTPAGAGLVDRVQAAGIDYRAVAENLATGRNIEQPAESALAGWRASDGHRRNLQSPRFTRTGVGFWRQGKRHYLTQIYLRPPQRGARD